MSSVIRRYYLWYRIFYGMAMGLTSILEGIVAVLCLGLYFPGWSFSVACLCQELEIKYKIGIKP